MLHILTQYTLHKFSRLCQSWIGCFCRQKDLRFANTVADVVVIVIVECFYEPRIFSHSVATSSAECNRCSPLQLGLWTAVDNMWHCLAFATTAHVGCCKAPLLAGCTVALVCLEAIQESPVAFRLSIRDWEELTTRADVIPVCLHACICMWQFSARAFIRDSSDGWTAVDGARQCVCQHRDDWSRCWVWTQVQVSAADVRRSWVHLANRLPPQCSQGESSHCCNQRHIR